MSQSGPGGLGKMLAPGLVNGFALPCILQDGMDDSSWNDIEASPMLFV